MHNNFDFHISLNNDNKHLYQAYHKIYQINNAFHVKFIILILNITE